MKEAVATRPQRETAFSNRSFADFKPKIDIRSVPANDIPLERGSNHVHLKSTAKHESKHAVVSLETGQGMSFLTVEPKGNVLGSVTPARVDNTAAFQTTAMASSVDDHPEGTGSDVYQATILQYASGGISKESAFKEASKIIKQYNSAFWDKLSDLVAYVKNATESQFKQLMERAEWEVQRDQDLKKQKQFPREGIIFQRQQTASL